MRTIFKSELIRLHFLQSMLRSRRLSIGGPKEPEEMDAGKSPEIMVTTPIGAIVKNISSLPSDVQKTKKLSFDECMNISKGHQILT